MVPKPVFPWILAREDQKQKEVILPLLPPKDGAWPPSPPKHALSLGQQLDLICVDDKGDITKGGFYQYSARDQWGNFAILAPKYNKERVTYELGKKRAEFVSIYIM